MQLSVKCVISSTFSFSFEEDSLEHLISLTGVFLKKIIILTKYRVYWKNGDYGGLLNILELEN